MTTNINWKILLLIFVVIYSILLFKESMTNTKNFNTKFPGRFEVYLNGRFVHKKPKESKYNIELLKQIEEEGFDVYRDTIKNAYKTDYNNTVRGFNVKRNSGYSSVYVDGYRLDKIDKEIIKPERANKLNNTFKSNVFVVLFHNIQNKKDAKTDNAASGIW